MRLLDRFLKHFGYAKTAPPAVFPALRRSYAAAATNRITASWTVSSLTSDAELRTGLRPLRARSRDLAINNDYARKFIWMVIANVVGPNGVGLQLKIKDANGSYDRAAIDLIEEAWAAWSRRGNCDVTGRHSFRGLQRIIVESVARDGEILIRKIWGFDNSSGYALQILEPDHLDENLNQSLPNGNAIRLGVETDRWGRPVAYHMLTDHPGDYQYSLNGQRYMRLPASEVIHLFVQDRPTQSRGVPWMHSAMTRLNNLGGYEEAEIVAARSAANHLGIITTPSGNEFLGEGTDASGNMIMDTEVGMMVQLPRGADWKEFDPTHPAGNFAPFMKATLRGIASGLLVSYNSLSSDLEGVSYSSIRAGVLEERDMWRLLQNWFIDECLSRIFESWLSWMLTTQTIPLPVSRFQKYNQPAWQPRGWEWVDPLKDIQASIAAVEAGFDSRSRIVAAAGKDFEEIIEELAAEKAAADRAGLVLTASGNRPSQTADDDTGGTP